MTFLEAIWFWLAEVVVRFGFIIAIALLAAVMYAVLWVWDRVTGKYDRRD